MRGAHIGNLPAEVNSFIGRERELAEVRKSLVAARLVTLTGIGGVGKTRLALRVASQMRRTFRHGVWMVQLGSLAQADLLAETVADAFGLVHGDPLRSLTNFLADKQILLVVDNCEHLTAPSAALIDSLLRGAQGLRVLATSRHALHTPDEHVVRVHPLPLPASGRAAARKDSEAVQLFSDRGTAAEPGFAVTPDNWLVVADICRHLDGIPLGIELATAWLRALSPEEILERLDDRFRLLTKGSRAAPARHRTLRAMLDWSYDLCSDEEKSLWARLSVFVGGFDLHAAEQVCGTDVTAGVAALVDKSIVLHHGSRYHLLETIRQYGRLQLTSNGDLARLRRRHRDHFLALAGHCAAEWFGPGQSSWCTRLRGDHGNFRAALDFCASTPGEARSGLVLSATLWFYWTSCGAQPAEQRFWLDKLLELDTSQTVERTSALSTLSAVAAMQGDLTTCLDAAVSSLDLALRLDAVEEQANAIRVIGLATLMTGEHQRSTDLFHEVLRRYAELGSDGTFAAITRFELASALLFLGDVDRAFDLCEEAVSRCEARGEKWVCSYVLNTLVMVAFRRGDTEQALEYAQKCLRIKRSFHDVIGIRIVMELFAWLADAAGDAARTAELLGAVEMIRHTFGLGEHVSSGYIAPRLQCVANARRALGDVGYQEAVTRGEKRSLDEAVQFALGEEPAPPVVRGRSPADVLTRRETQVARLVAHGHSNQEVARRLVISRRTAEGHVARIMAKLDFTSRSQIATWVVEHGLE